MRVQGPTGPMAQIPIGFPVSPAKFWIMSILTCFLYPLYWGYQNFRHLKVKFNNPIGCAIYGAFLPWSLILLNRALVKSATDQGASIRFQSIRVALTFLLLSLFSGALAYGGQPLVGRFVSVLSLVPLFQVQCKINAVNAQLRPNVEPDSRFSPWDYTGILLVLGYVAVRLFLAHLKKG